MVSHGEVYWCDFPQPDRRRPVLVLTRDSAIGHLNSVTVASITRAIRITPVHVRLTTDDGLRETSVVNLDLIQTVRRSAIGPFIARLSPERMREVYAAIQFALGFETYAE